MQISFSRFNKNLSKFNKKLLTFKKGRDIFLSKISVFFSCAFAQRDDRRDRIERMCERRSIGDGRLRNTMKDKYLLLAKCAVNVMCALGIPTTIAVPFFLKWYGKINNHFAGALYPIQSVMFVISGVFACLIVFELRSMLKTVDEDNCFVMNNVISLERMGWYSFIIAIVSMIRLALYVTPGCFAIIIVFIIAGLFSKVLGKVFKKAIEYKEDNDLTI